MATTPEQGWTVPDNTTPPNTLGAVIAAAFGTAEKQSVQKYATAAARNSAIPAPTPGRLAYLLTPGILTVYTGSSWSYVMNNVTQDLNGTFTSGGVAVPNVPVAVFDQDITVSGPCVLEVEVGMTLNMAAPPTTGCRGTMGIRIGGINVRNMRWNNAGASGLATPFTTGVANVAQAGTVNVQFDLKSDGSSDGNVGINEVNWAIRERSPR